MYAFLAITFISFSSLISLLVFSFLKKYSLNLSVYLISLAVGCLLGDAFFHLIPGSLAQIDNHFLFSLLLTFGFFLFFIIEKFLFWHHCHNPTCHEANSSAVVLNLVGDTVHNFIDGLLIAASFQNSLFLGLTTTLAVFFHEIPQELGDFGIFLHHGFSPLKALKFNLLSACSAFLGALLVFPTLSVYLLPVTAGGFIYLAACDLIPTLHLHSSTKSISLFQIFFIFLGLVFMSALVLLER